MLFMRREFASAVVRSLGDPSVLDVGCGSGRVAEILIEAGASRYVGVDFSEPMLELAGKRLERFGDDVTLVTGDFMTTDLEGPFDVVVALGFFDYIEDPAPFALRMSELCTGSLVASFPKWSWIKGPVRKLRYEVFGDCPIFDYTPRELQLLFRTAGFARVESTTKGAGILIRAEK